MIREIQPLVFFATQRRNGRRWIEIWVNIYKNNQCKVKMKIGKKRVKRHERLVLCQQGYHFFF